MLSFINIFLVTDNQNIPNVKATVRMIKEYSTQTYLYNVFILHNGVSESNRMKVYDLIIGSRNVKISFYLMDESNFSTPIHNKSPHLSKVARFKFLIGNFNIKKALYIDTDILIRKDIAALFQVDLEGFVIGAVPDINSTNKLFLERLDLPASYKYFNSGVLLIDCDRWKQHDLSKELKEISIRNMNKIIFVDQDAFNLLFSRFGYKKLDLTWNVPSANQYYKYSIFNYIKLYNKSFSLLQIINSFYNPSIVHFIGQPKPTDENLKNPFSSEYVKYLG